MSHTAKEYLQEAVSKAQVKNALVDTIAFHPSDSTTLNKKASKRLKILQDLKMVVKKGDQFVPTQSGWDKYVEFSKKDIESMIKYRENPKNAKFLFTQKKKRKDLDKKKR